MYITNHHYYAAPMPQHAPLRRRRQARPVATDHNVTHGLVNALENLGVYIENMVTQSVVGGGARPAFAPDVSNWVAGDHDSLREIMGDQFADMVQNNPDIRVFFEMDPRSDWSTDHGEAQHLTPDEVNALRHYTFTTHDSDPMPCGICQNNLERDDVLIELPCKHAFHQECVSPWLLTQSNTCPLCRAEVIVDGSDGTPEPPLSP